MSVSETFLYKTLCVFSQIKDRKHIEQNFYSVAQGLELGGASKTLSAGICDGAS